MTGEGTGSNGRTGSSPIGARDNWTTPIPHLSSEPNPSTGRSGRLTAAWTDQLAEIVAILDAGIDSEWVAIDVETTGLGPDLSIRTLQWAYMTDRGPVGALIDLSEPAAIDVANRMLAQYEGHLISYGSFDAYATRCDPRIRPTRITNAVPLAHLRDQEGATMKGGLKSLMKRHGLGEYVTDVTAKATLKMTTTDPVFRLYAITDALALAHLADGWFRDSSAQGDLQAWLDREQALADVASAMGQRGVLVDPAILEELAVLYEGQRVQATTAAHALDPLLKNIGSAAQVEAALQRRGVELPRIRRKRKDGTSYNSTSTGRHALTSNDPLARAVQTARSKASAVTFVTSLRDHADDHNRIHTRWNTLGARSSRWSSSNPNLQNVAKHGEHLLVRSAFIPAPGCAFVQADLSQIEYRVAAALSGDAAMLQVFAEGGDLHLHAARALAGHAEPTEQDRSQAKGIGFGKLYGSSLEATARAAGVPAEVMADRITKYDRTFPQLASWCQRLYRSTTVQGPGPKTPTTPYGRQFSLPGAHTAVNYVCQSTARELFADWLLGIDREFPGYLVLAIHDEVVLEVPHDEADEVAVRVALLAEDANANRPQPLDLVRIVAESSVALTSWYDAYRKDHDE